MTQSTAAALLLSTLAGLSTGLGGLLAVSARKISPRWLAGSLGFSAGIMLTLSLADLLPHAVQTLTTAQGLAPGVFTAAGALLVGALSAALLDGFLPSPAPPLSAGSRPAIPGAGGQQRGRLLRLGFFAALAMMLHNLPEGMATFMSGCTDLRAGASLAVAVALHNIPEGIAIALPLYCATGRRGGALGWTLVSGLSEPLGALLAWGLLFPFLTDALLALLLAFIAGLMTYIVFAQLLPAANDTAPGRAPLLGAFAGVLLMILVIYLFA